MIVAAENEPQAENETDDLFSFRGCGRLRPYCGAVSLVATSCVYFIVE